MKFKVGSWSRSLKTVVKVDVVAFVLERRQWLFALCSLGMVTALGIYFFAIPYKTEFNFSINDRSNSVEQAFSQNFAETMKVAQAPAKRTDSVLAKEADYLNSSEFSFWLASEIFGTKNPESLFMRNKLLELINSKEAAANATDQNQIEISQTKLIAQVLQKALDVRANSASVLSVTLSGSNDSVVNFLAETLQTQIPAALKKRALEQISATRVALEAQAQVIRKEQEQSLKKLQSLQSQEMVELKIASAARLQGFVGDLEVRKSESDLRIRELKQIKKQMQGSGSGQYNRRLQSLNAELEILVQKRNELNAEINRLTKATQDSLASNISAVSLAQLKDKVDFYFKKDQQITDLLLQLSVLESSAGSRVERLNPFATDKTAKAVSLYILLAVCLIAAQLLFVVAVYLNYLFATQAQDEERQAGEVVLPVDMLLQAHSFEYKPNHLAPPIERLPSNVIQFNPNGPKI